MKEIEMYHQRQEALRARNAQISADLSDLRANLPNAQEDFSKMRRQLKKHGKIFP